MKNLPAINKRYIYLLILFIAGSILFWAVKDLFFFDEDIFVTESSSEFMAKIWQRTLVGKLSYRWDYFIWGKNPFGYHFTNFILHLVNAVLALLLLKELLKLLSNQINGFQAKLVPYIFFILFLITPVHSEPLCYILARGCSVVSFFLLLSLLLFLKAEPGGKWHFFFSLLSFLMALFSYEISWTMPFMVLCIILFISFIKNESLKKNLRLVIPYFLIFAVWFIIKVVVIDKMTVSDYKDENLLGISFVTLGKNSIVLFLRNFIPPFENAAAFLFLSIVFILIFIAGLFILYKKYRQVFYFSVLLMLLAVLGFSPTVFLGIDSHDSESERYIYFSSVFALMLLSVLITVLIKNKITLTTVVFLLCSVYILSLFKTINGYKAAGDFSRLYLQEIDKRINSNATVFFVNIPAQHNGALLFRAKSRIGGNSKDNVSVMQEYLSYLYNKSNVCITLSAKELNKVPGGLIVNEKPVDSITVFFPEIRFNKQKLKIGIAQNNNFSFAENNSIVVALKDSALYFFK